MKKVLLSTTVLLFLSLSAWSQCRDIRIPRGQISTSVSAVTRSTNLCYRIRAKRGQTITLHLASANKRVSFSLSEDYYDSDFTAEDVRDWEGEIGNVNAYLISVGGARSGTPFKFEVTVR